MFSKTLIFTVFSVLFITGDFQTDVKNSDEKQGLFIKLTNLWIKWKTKFMDSIHSISLPNYFTSKDAKLTLGAKCYKDLGCIRSNSIFDYLKTFSIIALNPQKTDVRFILFTRLNRNQPQILDHKANQTQIRNSLFNPFRKTKIIIHGYLASYKPGEWMESIKNYCLDHSDYNVFAIDWSDAGGLRYLTSIAVTRVVGAKMAFFIRRLINVTNASVNDFHCIGHSLGAHICGSVGQRFKSPKLAQISGLDPACPGFMEKHRNTRLDQTDAELVTVIHTNAGIYDPEFRKGATPFGLTGILGNKDNLGHFDFWPNGGTKQPGCGIDESLNMFLKNPRRLFKAPTCNHERAHDYPLYSNQNGCQMIGYLCTSFHTFKKGLCADCGTDNQKCRPMDFNFEYWDNFNKSKLNKNQKNNFYLRISSSEPYCLFHYQILVQLSANHKMLAMGQLGISINGKNIYFFIPDSTPFLPKREYTKLYVYKKELTPTDVNVMWNSLFRQPIRIDKIIFKFMSHINESVRKQKSFELCPPSNGKLPSGSTMFMETC